MERYVVVGGGITGLAAAWELVQHVPGRAVTLLEGSPRLGGRLRGADVGGVRVDVGAESMLARRPEGVTLVQELGLGEELVHPTGARASVASRGRLHPLPEGTLMGVPADPARLAGLLTDEEVARARAEEVPDPEPEAEDVALGQLVAERLGDAVVDRLLEPLLGGVYAGHARELSTAAVLPVLLEAHRQGRSLTEVAAERLAGLGSGGEAGPVFAGLRGGLHRLVEDLVVRLRARGVTIRDDTVVRELHPVPETDLWQLVTGPVPDPTGYLAERVVLALPPTPAGRLLQPHAPVAAARLQRVPTASMAIVTLALPAAATPELPGSGLLVPPVEGRTVKAATFSAGKWDWVRGAGRGAGPRGGDLVLLRASVGRHREEAALQHDDAELVHLVLHDLGELLGAPLPHPVDSHVQRWGGALPQYPVGHPAVVAEVLAEVAGLDGIEVAGAAYHGVGVPACIGAGRAAARRAAGVDAGDDRGPDPG